MVPSYYLPIIHVLVYGLSLAVPFVLQTTQIYAGTKVKKKTNKQEAEDGFTNVSGSPLVFMKMLFVSGLI